MKKSSYTDREIIDGIQTQNNLVIQYIYRKNFRSVRHYIEENNGTSKDAEDLFQETMILLYFKVKEPTFELRCSFHTYLFSIIKIFWLRQLTQKEKRRIETSDCDALISDDVELLDNIVQTERKNLFLKHFNELSEDCQKIIKLFIHGLSITEITKVMGYSSEQHTKNRRFRCKKSLLTKISQNPQFKELANGTMGENYQVPRW